MPDIQVKNVLTVVKLKKIIAIKHIINVIGVGIAIIQM